MIPGHGRIQRIKFQPLLVVIVEQLRNVPILLIPLSGMTRCHRCNQHHQQELNSGFHTDCVTGKLRFVHSLAYTAVTVQPTDRKHSPSKSWRTSYLLTMRFAELVPLLQVAVGPVILISGIGLLLLSMTNRFGRVIDRTRQVAEAARRAPSDKARYQAQIAMLRRRANLLRGAIILAVASVLSAALLVITVFVTALIESTAALHIVILFLTCMLLLILSLVVFILDLNLSLEAMNLDTSIEQS
jgi:hypothetical protein